MNKLTKKISLFSANGIVYGLNALYYCFIQIYISRYHPDDVAGILLAIGPLVSIFAPVFWGILADRSKSKNRVLAVAISGSAVFYCLLGVAHSFWYLAVMLTLLMFFMSPFGGMVDIITLEYTTENKIPYGPMRICGTLVFGLIPMLLTGFTENNISLIFYAYAIMAVIGVFAVMSSPQVAGHASGKRKTSIMPIIRDSKLMIIFLFTGVAQFTWAYYLNYFPNHLTNDLGLSQQVWGVNVFITVLGEIPFFLMFNRLYEKLGIKRLIFTGLILIILRYAGLAYITNVPLLLAVGLFTGVATTIFTYSGSIYITKHTAPENKASANLLMYALANGVPKVLAGVLGGKMNVAFGYTRSMVICTLLCVISLAVFFAVHKRLLSNID